MQGNCSRDVAQLLARLCQAIVTRVWRVPLCISSAKLQVFAGTDPDSLKHPHQRPSRAESSFAAHLAISFEFALHLKPRNLEEQSQRSRQRLSSTSTLETDTGRANHDQHCAW